MTLKIVIKLAQAHQTHDCLSCVEHSDLWDAYFKANPTVENSLLEMIHRKQIYVAVDLNEACVGFMGIIHQGCFRRFSYLSLIAVKREHRRKGIGRKLIEKFETFGFEKADRLFILVSDFNDQAQQLYHRLGYQKVGLIPDLFKDGISEHLMVKYKKASTA